MPVDDLRRVAALSSEAPYQHRKWIQREWDVSAPPFVNVYGPPRRQGAAQKNQRSPQNVSWFFVV